MKYRLLTDGDIIQKGDEFIEDDGETWTPVGRNARVSEMWTIGMVYRHGGILKQFRRKISED